MVIFKVILLYVKGELYCHIISPALVKIFVKINRWCMGYVSENTVHGKCHFLKLTMFLNIIFFVTLV